MATSEIRSSWRETRRRFSDLVSGCRELSNSMSPFAFFPGYSQHDAENPAAVRENYPEQIGKVCSAASNDSVIFQIQLEREAAKTAAPCWWDKSFPGWRIKQYFKVCSCKRFYKSWRPQPPQVQQVLLIPFALLASNQPRNINYGCGPAITNKWVIRSLWFSAYQPACLHGISR